MNASWIQTQIDAFWEIEKDIARWAIAGAIGAFLDYGYSFFTRSKLDPTIIAVISFVFKYADFYWHRWNKLTKQGETGKSMGIIPF